MMHSDQAVSDAVGLLAAMIVVFAIGVVVDRLLFARLERAIRTRWGLGPARSRSAGNDAVPVMDGS